MSNKRIAIRYAKSLVTLAQEEKALDQTYEDMMVFDKACENSREFETFLKSPIVKTELKRKILKKIFENKIGKLAMAFLDIITSKKREGMLKVMIEQFLRLYKQIKNIVSAQIITAVELEPELRTLIKEKLKLANKADIELSEVVNKKIIGGFVLRIDDTQIDASVAKDLRAVKKAYNLI